MAEEKTLRPNTEQSITILAAIANENRLKILYLLLDSERTVTELGTKIDLAQSPVSQHLAKLRKLRIVDTRRDGQLVYYRLTSPEVRQILVLLRQLYPQ